MRILRSIEVIQCIVGELLLCSNPRLDGKRCWTDGKSEFMCAYIALLKGVLFMYNSPSFSFPGNSVCGGREYDRFEGHF